MKMRMTFCKVACLGVFFAGMGSLGAADPLATSYNVYGMVGHIEMPNAQSAHDGELSFGISQGGETLRTTLAFQVTPRLAGAFRYSRIGKYNPDGSETYDRSFDLRYQLFDESTYRPAVAVGLQDVIGTGIFSAEYVAATKTFGSVTATAGLGWGRLGSYQPFGTVGTRPTGTTGPGGQFESAKWFRGDVAAFGGLTWAVNDRLSLKAEYSSDAQILETDRDQFDRKSPFNFGLDYRLRNGVQLSAYALHGSTIGLAFTAALDPKNSPLGATRDGAPVPVAPRSAQPIQGLGWTANAGGVSQALATGVAPALAQMGITLDGLVLSADRATVRIINNRYASQAQAAGRVARVLATVLPASIETFDIVPMVRGLPAAKIQISRFALEQFENTPNAAQDMLAATPVKDASSVDRRIGGLDTAQQFTWAIKPYAQAALFDPTSPLRLDAGLELDVEWVPTPGLYFNGLVRQSLVGNLDKSSRFSDSVLPHVRSDANFYDKADGPVLEKLTAAYFYRPGKDLYGRVTAGYLERQYGGISTEVLWKPVNSRFALGLEVNYAKQRSWEGLGFKPNTVVSTDPVTDAGFVAGPRSYDVVTGHVSGYYQLATGFHAQLDVGRYLAGDWGATFTLDREFKNGWRVGAYATLTDVPFDEFGEGSFDKGIRITIPLDWQAGTPSRQKTTATIQPLLRDGGARLQVDDRLYDLVRDTHTPALEDRWSRFWR